MKNTMLLTIPALLALAAAGWAAANDPCPSPNNGFCYWPPKDDGDDKGGCYEINIGEKEDKNCSVERANCVEHGYLYYEVTYPKNEWGAGNTCEELGGVWSEIGNDPDFNEGVPLWCKWATSCESIKSDKEKENCIKNGSVFENVLPSGVGEGKTCQGGTWTQEGRDPDAVMIGCCNWDGEGCFAVFETTEWSKCKSAERYTTCPNNEAGTCRAADKWPSSSSVATAVPSSSSIATAVSSSSSITASVSSSSSAAEDKVPSSSSLREYAYCVFVSTQECYEGPVTTCPASALLQDDCPYNSSSSAAAATSSSSGSSSSVSGSSSSGDGSSVSSSSGVSGSSSSQTYAYCVYVEDRMCLPWRYSPCPGGGIDNDTCPYNSSSSSSDANSPILSHSVVHSNALTAMHNAVKLQSMGNATVQIFDLKGKAVRALRFSPGSYMVPLSGLPRGLYIVRVSGASWKQTIKVAVK